MRYLTKEWYELCQKTGLHYGLRAHKAAEVFDEAFYERMRKQKENAFLKEEKEFYNLDPRYRLEEDDSVFVKAFDLRGSFDTDLHKSLFSQNHEAAIASLSERLPVSLYAQVADPRVFALGYCSKRVLKELKKINVKNLADVNRILKECREADMNEDIPVVLRQSLCFHDREVKAVKANEHEHVVIEFVPTGYAEDYNSIVFYDAQIIKQEKPIEGSYWLYRELYRTTEGYEVHVLFYNDIAHEFTLQCKSIEVNR